ncbi:hypothetical protein A9Q95_09005 [Rhodobacterales bacterium 59_46_T64]|nr:hypothetical protein A9Q95_09005 [Rhodobacterales bacterium 59_46_T64]
MIFVQQLSQQAVLMGLASTLVLSVPVAGRAEEIFEMDAITVTGSGLAVGVMDNASSITVLGEDQIERAVPTSVARLLRDVPGVQISEDGIERISIRSQTASRTAVLINGQMLTDHSNYGQPILIDPASIERIEVVRGPTSVVAGSSAVGGVINIILKKGAQVPFEMTTTVGYFSATRGYRVSHAMAGTVAAGQGALDYRIGLGRSEQGNRHTSTGVLDPSDSEDKSLTLHLGYRQNNHYFALDAMAFDLSANSFTEIDDFTIALPKRDLRKFALSYEGVDLSPVVNKFSFSVFDQSIDRVFDSNISVAAGPMQIDSHATSEDAQSTRGFSAQAELSFGPRSRSLVGVDYSDDALVTDKTSTRTVTNPFLPFPTITQTTSHDRASIQTLAIYGQHEVDLTPDVTATMGLRWYDVTAKLHASTTDGVANALSANSDQGVLGAAGLVWRRGEDLTLRANISSGYSYPTLSQMFLTTKGGQVTYEGNPDLRPEKANTFELGARFDRGDLLLDATMFYTESKDYIAKIATGTTGTWQNVDSARSFGVELQAEYQPAEVAFRPYATVTLMRREMTYANGYSTYDSGTPAAAGRIGLRGDWQRGTVFGDWDLFVRGESAAGLRDDSGVMEVASRGHGYATFNAAMTAELSNGLRLSAEVGNIFDIAYEGYDQNPGAGRSLNLVATYKW